MAIMQVSYMSAALMRNVTFNAAVPTSMQPFPELPPKKPGPLKAMYLLHGGSGDFTHWLHNTSILTLAEQNGVAVFMPSGENSMYLDDPVRGNNFADYIGRELVTVTRELFHLSEKPEDTCIAGLSMGGYGAIRNGLKYCDTFGWVAGLSSVFVPHIIPPLTNDAPIVFGRRAFFEEVFGDLDKLHQSDKDPEGIVLLNKAAGKPFPKLFIGCGTEDTLLEPNRRYRDFLKAQGVDVVYEEGPGGHDWKFWETYIEKVMKWLKQG